MRSPGQPLTDEDDARQMWQPLLARRRWAADHADRAELVQIVDTTESRDGDEGGRLALPEQILDFVRAESCIDGDEDRANLRQRELQDDPLGDVGRPHGDTVARFHPAGCQAAGDETGFVVQRAKGPARIGVVVDERVAVRQGVGQPREETTHRDIPKCRGTRHDRAIIG